MLFYLKLYVMTVPVFLLVDMIWLGVIAKEFYRKHLGFLMSPQVNWLAALGFYLLFVVGLIVFAVNPALEKASWVRAGVLGALFGMMTYATYDMTNLATIKGWPVVVTVTDILWGMVLCSIVSVSSFWFARWLA
jgi:uncharacterized membrane protein